MIFSRLHHWAFASALLSSLAMSGAQSQSPSTAHSASSATDSSIFAPLSLPPAPSTTRSANGAPGAHYWQNRASYDLQATLDTVTGTIQGSMVLHYTNHSPQTLDALWFQTEQNRFRNDPASAGGDSAKAHTYGDIIDQFTEHVNGKAVPVQLEDHATETKVTLPTPLKPGATATFTVTWHFTVPVEGDRMDRQGSLYQIAQWYPRLNVYDDVKGWNIEPYLGQGEFFLEYGDFTMNVTVPANYVVAATGTLDNPNDVLTPAEIDRLKQAMTADTVIHVITASELTSGAARPKHDGMVTWKFHAKDVRDAVWCAAPDYQWDATHWKGVLVQAYYRPPAVVTWKEAADMVRMSIQEYSERWAPYPYPQVTAAEGPVHGMEYPMLSMDATFNNEPRLYLSITHEVGHEWFPMLVGSNERVHQWMDEGVNQFINTFSNARRYPDRGDQIKRADQYRTGIEDAVTQHQDAIIEVPSDSVDGNRYGYIAYFKPAGVLQMLRRDVLGPELFDKG
ncbi:MAG TPA: M1 family metallopeptidase, partial [Gemmatimonadaceae bacterium]|nr:M1 family metallopeptidase [Gemmatimonadaceae bacterium]